MNEEPTTIKAFLPPHTSLGESPLYRASDNTLHYIDVLNATIHVVDLSNPMNRRTIACPEPIASLNFCLHPPGYLVCTYTGIARLTVDGAWTTLREVIPPKDRGKVRLNDSAVDCEGRLWVGSLDIWLDASDFERPHLPANYHPLGSLYRFDPDGSLYTIVHGGFVCSNGLGWTPDHRVMFHTDSFRQVIWAYDYTPETGEISNQRVWIDRSGLTGEPDGLVVDCVGNLFTFIWGGGALEKYDSSGRLRQKWTLEALNVTHGAWVGEAMDQLLITTATAATIDQGGGLFLLTDAGSRGMHRNVFGDPRSVVTR